MDTIFSSGKDLNIIGKYYNIKRRWFERDKSYKKRILSSINIDRVKATYDEISKVTKIIDFIFMKCASIKYELFGEW